MSSLRTIRNRIKGTRNIKQITRAMEAVSAVKMRKSQSVALAARPYATSALEILRSLKQSAGGSDVHPFLAANTEQTRKEEPFSAQGYGRAQHGADAEKRTLLVVVTSDKGLAGAFNANVLKKAEQFARSMEIRLPQVRGSLISTPPVVIAAVGKKATDYFSRRGRKPLASWTGFGDYAELAEVEPLFDFVLASFSGKAAPPRVPPLKRGEGRGVQADEVYIIYTNFLSAMKQEVVVRKLLPFSEEGLEEMVRGIVPERGRFAEPDANLRMDANAANQTKEYLFEPSPKEIFDAILPALLKIQLYHAILEANASEHSSRMVAMRNATDNATELIKSYTVSMNKARQSAINKELAEITGGSEALAN